MDISDGNVNIKSGGEKTSVILARSIRFGRVPLAEFSDCVCRLEILPGCSLIYTRHYIPEIYLFAHGAGFLLNLLHHHTHTLAPLQKRINKHSGEMCNTSQTKIIKFQQSGSIRE